MTTAVLLSTLSEGSVLRQPTHRRPRCSSRRNISNEIEFAAEVAQTVQDIRSDRAPFNWVVCGYETLENEKSKQKLIVIEKGMVRLQLRLLIMANAIAAFAIDFHSNNRF